MHDLDLTNIKACEAAFIRLPHGRLLELEWLDGENYAIRVTGFESQSRYAADEEYRLAGFEPLLRAFAGYLPMPFAGEERCPA